MESLQIGVESLEDGHLEFFGLDEVNQLISQGRRVVRIEPGDVIVDSEDDGDVADIDGAPADATAVDAAAEGEEIDDDEELFVIGFQVTVVLE